MPPCVRDAPGLRQVHGQVDHLHRYVCVCVFVCERAHDYCDLKRGLRAVAVGFVSFLGEALVFHE